MIKKYLFFILVILTVITVLTASSRAANINVIPPSVSQGGITVATYIIAANDSPHANEADYTVPAAATAQSTINQAINALPATGGRILLLEGTYEVTGTIYVDSAVGGKSNVTIMGLGNGTKIKVKDSTNSAFPIFGVSGAGNIAGLIISELYIDANKTNNPSGDNLALSISGIATDGLVLSNVILIDGAGVSVDSGSNVQIFNNFFAWGTSGSTANLSLTNTDKAILTKNYLRGTVTLSGNNIIMTSNRVQETASLTAFSLQGSYCSVSGNTFNTNNGNFSVSSLSYSVISDNIFSSTAGSLFTVDVTSSDSSLLSNTFTLVSVTSNASRMVLSKNILKNSTSNGITVTGSNSNISGNAVYAASRHGYYVSGNNNTLSSNTVASASMSANNTYDGIFLAAGASYNTLQYNRIRYNSVAPQNRYGIRVDDVTCSGNMITNNDLRTSGISGGFSDLGIGTITSANNRL